MSTTTTTLRDQLRHDPELRDQLRRDHEQRTAAALKRYRALLLASDPADPARLEELRDVISTLGLTTGDVDADIAAIAAHAAATAAAPSPGQRAAAEAEVAKAWADARAEARGVVLQIFDRLSRDTFLDAVYDFYSSAVQSAQGVDLAEIAKLNCFERLWGQVNGAERAAARRLDQAKTVDAKAGRPGRSAPPRSRPGRGGRGGARGTGY